MQNRLKLSGLGIVLLLVVSNAHSTVKGCVNVFLDGTEQCSPVLLGTLCEIQKGSTITINGKKVVNKYQVKRCPDHDDLGRITNGHAAFGNAIRQCNSDYDTCYDRYDDGLVWSPVMNAAIAVPHILGTKRKSTENRISKYS